MTQNDRVRIIRKSKSLTLEKFGERIGVGKTAISKIESGERGVTEQMCRSICREFSINETWLRTGEGEMYLSESHFDLNEYAKQCGATDVDIEIIRIYLSLPSELRNGLVNAFRSAFQFRSKSNYTDGTKDIYLHISDAKQKNSNDEIDKADLTPAQEIEVQVESYRRQLLAEKKAAALDSSRSAGEEDGRSETA